MTASYHSPRPSRLPPYSIYGMASPIQVSFPTMGNVNVTRGPPLHTAHSQSTHGKSRKHLKRSSEWLPATPTVKQRATNSDCSGYAYPPQPRSALRNTPHLSGEHHGFYTLPSRSISQPTISPPQSNSRPRRATVTWGTASYIQDGFSGHRFPIVKFKRSGARSTGVSIHDAKKDLARLSRHHHYTLSTFHPERQNTIRLIIQWDGYGQTEKYITLEVEKGSPSGRVDLQTLARRTARVCDGFLKSFRVPVAPHTVHMHHLEEVARGVWRVKLSTQ